MQTRSKTKQLNETEKKNTVVHLDVQPRQNKHVHLAIQPQQSNHDPIFYHQQIPVDYDLFQKKRDQTRSYLFLRIYLMSLYAFYGLGLIQLWKPWLPWHGENHLSTDESSQPTSFNWAGHGIDAALILAFAYGVTELMMKCIEPTKPRLKHRTVRFDFSGDATTKPEPEAQPRPACKM